MFHLKHLPSKSYDKKVEIHSYPKARTTILVAKVSVSATNSGKNYDIKNGIGYDEKKVRDSNTPESEEGESSGMSI